MSNLDRNLETLSAYLDGELTGKERVRIEGLLQEDENLRTWYEELKRTRSVLRSAPTLRAPRNYYLTPEMVGQKEKPGRAFPILRFASAFAAFLLVLLFLGDLFVVPRPLMAPARSVQFADSVQVEEEAAVMEAEVFASQPPAAPAEPLMQEAPMEGEPAAEAESDENISSSTDSALIMGKALPTQLPAPVEEAEDMLGGAVVETLVVEDLELEPVESRELLEDEDQPIYELRSLVRITEYALLVIAISTGIAAFYLFRRMGSH